MNKLLREVPSMESWISGGSSEFVQVSLHKDFIKTALDKLKVSVDNWLKEPIQFCEDIGKLQVQFSFKSFIWSLNSQQIRFPD